MAKRIAVLGFAHGHVGGYLKTWRERPELGIEAVAGWDHDTARLAKAAADHGLAAEPDLDRLLARADVEAVVIAAETSRHAELVERAAAAGRAIVLQKPLALTLAEADRIVAAVGKSGVPFTMAWQMRVDPQNLKMRELVASGVLGRLFMVRRRHGLATHRWAGFADLWHNRPELNRDIFADDAAHPIDFLLWLLGPPESVTAELVTVADPRIPNDNGIVLFRYPGGPLAEACCSFTCLAAENTTEIVAERGVIVQSFGDVPGCVAPRPENRSGLKWYLAEPAGWTYSDIPSPASHWERILGLSAPISEFLHGRRPAIATAAEGRESLRAVLACYVSTREGRRVLLDDPAIRGV
jgi:predicted dehydrogenase